MNHDPRILLYSGLNAGAELSPGPDKPTRSGFDPVTGLPMLLSRPGSFEPGRLAGIEDQSQLLPLILHRLVLAGRAMTGS